MRNFEKFPYHPAPRPRRRAELRALASLEGWLAPPFVILRGAQERARTSG
jgi:hypothetical protein